MKLFTLLGAIGLGALTAKAAFAMTYVALQAGGASAPTLGSLIALAGAVATSFALAGVKKTDTSISNSDVFKKLQPFITLGGAYFAPWLSAKLGVQVDPQAFAAAPLATVITIGSAELLSLAQKKVGS